MNNKNIPIRKKWGQNFLIDRNIIRKIIKLINPESNDIVIEIGPGKGALTTYLSKKVKLIHAVEIDPLLFSFLKDEKIYNVKLINEDILKWKPLRSDYSKIIGNIPYNISSQIIFKFIKLDFWDKMILMIQKELAERIVSKHGNKTYGRISVMVQTFCNIHLEFNISKNVFIPKPKIDSSILSFQRKGINIDFNNFSIFVKEAFKQRRKKLKNNLKDLCNPELLGELSEKRPEQISVENFQKLYKKIYI